MTKVRLVFKDGTVEVREYNTFEEAEEWVNIYNSTDTDIKYALFVDGKFENAEEQMEV